MTSKHLCQDGCYESMWFFLPEMSVFELRITELKIIRPFGCIVFFFYEIHKLTHVLVFFFRICFAFNITYTFLPKT